MAPTPLRIHFHSDCAFFSGSENMLVTLFGSVQLRACHEISFSYRQSAAYESGLQQRVTLDFPTFPLSLSDPSEGLAKARGMWRGPAMLWFLISYYPKLLWQFLLFALLLKRIQPDVLHINNGGYPGALSCRAIALAGRAIGISRILMVVNNLAVPYSRPARWLDYPSDRLTAGAVSRFVTGSKAAATQLAKVLRLPVGRAVAVHNGVRVRPIHDTREETRARLGLDNFDGVVFGVVAILEPRKGHRTLIDAVAMLAARAGSAKVKVLIEGDGPLAAELAQQIEGHSLGDAVILVGKEARIFDFMGALDVLLLPSVRDEDFPNVIVEAMSLGRPVIASRLAGTPEQVDDGVTGLLVEPGNADMLAKAMQTLAGDGQLRRSMGEAAQLKFMSKFTGEVAVKHYLDVYGALKMRGMPDDFS